MSVVDRMVELGAAAVARGLRVQQFELSPDDYAEVRRYVETRAGVTGEAIAAEAGRLDPRSPYWGTPSRAAQMRAAAFRWHIDGCGPVPVVEVPGMLGGPVLRLDAL